MMMMKQSYTKENDMSTEIEIDADASVIKICEMIEQMEVILAGSRMTEGVTACASVLIGAMLGLTMSKDAILAALSEVIDVEMEAENE